jgi:hypothetical protein
MDVGVRELVSTGVGFTETVIFSELMQPAAVSVYA